jgi:diguanylate cyclase (GGDEF)-like protein
MVNPLDFQTLATVLMIKCFFQALGLGYVWHVNRKFGPARDWALGSLSLACGATLIAIDPFASSNIVILFRSILVYAGIYVICVGLVRACAGRVPWRLSSAVMFAALAADLWFTLWQPSFSARITIFSLVLTGGELYAAAVALRAPRGPMRGTQRLIALLLVAQAAATVLRGFNGVQTETITGFLTTPAQMLILLVSLAASFLLALLLAILTSQQTNALLAATLDNLNQGVAMFDAEQKLIICNDRYGEIYGLTADEVRPGTALKTIVRRRIARGIFSGGGPAEYFRERTAPVLRASVNLQHLSDGRSIAVSRRPTHGGGWVTTHEDVTTFRRIESELAHLAHHDALTGIANRLVFMSRMEEALVRLHVEGEEFCLILLDLDRFKAVNDSCGHPAGDALLKNVAQRLRSCTRPTDTVARLGGDEFAIIRTDAEIRRDDILDLVNRILRTIAAPCDLNGRKVVTGASIGIALAPHDAAAADQLMHKADLALYRAKSEGRNCCRFYVAEMDGRAQTRAIVEHALRKADLSENFTLQYQAFIDGRTGELRAGAAVPRWHGPDAERIGEIAFMDVAEESGLAIGFGEWLLHRACADAALWPQHVKLAVDLTPAQFAEGVVGDLVAKALAASGLPASRLTLRITEACLTEDGPSRLAMLRTLKERGISFTLADFGTGASSLKQLLAFPYDHIAIGAAFVADTARHSDGALIVAALTGFAASLGITAIAEDVTASEQFELLRAAGCSQFRGPLFGHHEIAEHRIAEQKACVA